MLFSYCFLPSFQHYFFSATESGAPGLPRIHLSKPRQKGLVVQARKIPVADGAHLCAVCFGRGLVHARHQKARLFGGAGRVQRVLSQPFTVAEKFTGVKGVMVPIEECIRGFNMILDGEVDYLPEQAFLNVGTIDDAIEKGKRLLSNAGK